MSGRDGAALVGLGAIWGSSFLFMRVAAPEMGAIPLILVRVAVAALFLVAVTAWRGELAACRGRWGALAFLGAINSAIPFCLFAHATKTLPAGFASVLNATVPLWSSAIGFLCWRERLPRIKVAGLLIGFAGVVALAWPKLHGGAERGAVAAGLAAAVSYGFAAHYARRRLSDLSPLAISTGSLIAATIELLPFAIATWPARAPGAAALGCGAVLGVVCTGVAYLFYFRLVGRIGAPRAVTVTYLVPLFGVTWGILFLGESLTLAMLLSGAVIVAGTILVARGPAIHPSAVATPATPATITTERSESAS